MPRERKRHDDAGALVENLFTIPTRRELSFSFFFGTIVRSSKGKRLSFFSPLYIRIGGKSLSRIIFF